MTTRLAAFCAVMAAVLIVTVFALPIQAQEGADTDDPSDAGRIGTLRSFLDSGAGDPFPEVVASELLDEEGKAAMRRALQGYYDYRSQGYEHRARVFEWQLLSSKIIFVIVITLVSIGIYFSWLQFRAGMVAQDKRQSQEDKPADEGDQDAERDTRTTVRFSGKGIEVSSPVLGVIILTISLAFLYLYLVYVFPIEETI